VSPRMPPNAKAAMPAIAADMGKGRLLIMLLPEWW
jgi:hypothetical protein